MGRKLIRGMLIASSTLALLLTFVSAVHAQAVVDTAEIDHAAIATGLGLLTASVAMLRAMRGK